MNPDIDDQPDPYCMGCSKIIEEGSVVAFGDGIWHVEWCVERETAVQIIFFAFQSRSSSAPLPATTASLHQGLQ
ncbi:hypothetical protein BC937DRAFT_95414 [Endogone sp. FLAS-F59071]|nr:hypothetical protein BC937DRAFT_95414 [Endogone sp. FLAS-F59071]|eukprot:RUS13382.1 hypothetical protein BC937DRAFT_95414 [Endogone sp. FLAS-F59071]